MPLKKISFDALTVNFTARETIFLRFAALRTFISLPAYKYSLACNTLRMNAFLVCKPNIYKVFEVLG